MYRKTVAGLPYFESVSSHFLAQAGSLLRPVRLDHGETLFEEGDPIDAVYFLKKGTIRLVLPGSDNAPDLVYATLRQGAIVGEVDYFAEAGALPARRFTART